MWPSVDHSLLSPSGHVSKRAQTIAKERARRELFGDGLEHSPLPTQPTERDYLLRKAAEFRALAERGFRPLKHRREAERLESMAAKF